MGISKTRDHIQIKIKMLNLIQDHPAITKSPNQDLKDMDVLCTINIKRAEIRNMGVSKTSDHIQINIKMPNRSQEPLAPKLSSK